MTDHTTTYNFIVRETTRKHTQRMTAMRASRVNPSKLKPKKGQKKPIHAPCRNPHINPNPRPFGWGR